jgi:hypothetical protein
MSGRKYGFLGIGKLPKYKGQYPTIEWSDYPYCVTFYIGFFTENEEMVCYEEGASLRIAKKRAFKKYREICKND